MTRKEFVEEFINNFMRSITRKQMIKTGLRISRGGEYKGKGYLWSIFDHDLVPCYKGNAARAEYDKVDKEGAVEIQYDVGCGDEEALSLEESLMSADDLDRCGYPEFYIIGKNFSWCYVMTHEMDLSGPYFAYRPK